MILKQLTTCFEETFTSAPETIFFAPGRVNLIGEHIDYNGGLVFPCAIDKGTYAAVSKREDNNFAAYSANFTKIPVRTLSLADLQYKAEDDWTNYIKGVLSVLIEKGCDIPFGLNIAIYGDLPNSAGLSSSACLEMLLCKVFDTYYDLSLSPVEMALIGKQVENNYIGVNSGIMDQFAVALGQKNTALLLNCTTQKYDLVPFNLHEYQLLIMNTNKKRTLADSKYNERFDECQTALAQLKAHFDIHHLCDLKEAQLPEVEKLLNSPVLFKRVRHTVTENERVHKAVSALKAGDLETFGSLLNSSHLSLKDDYEVSGVELDTLVKAALDAGALGARMTGAGFGGCAICLVRKDAAEKLIKEVDLAYEKEIGYKASFYETTTGNGPIQLQ